ncbi:MAG: transglutaminase family protein [Desulfocapsa sp.]|nr:transglutaminase family protein [Desulfocapsa sp.]
MIFSVTHVITYQYENLVFLERQTLRLKPRTDGMQQLLHFDIDIVPYPAGLTECRDLDGNMEHVAWFNGTTDRLVVTVTSKVVTFCVNPFECLLKKEARHLPLAADNVYQSSIKPYLSDAITPDVAAFAGQIAVESNQDTLAFLQLLNERLYSTCEVVFRQEGPPFEPSQTLCERRGACRDLTWLFMACCRSQGIGTRFISGYQEGCPESKHYLHGWAEVYLPGAGWRGYDPSLGVVVSDHHVALAAGPRVDSAAPISGTFRGEGGVVTESVVDVTVTAS